MSALMRVDSDHNPDHILTYPNFLQVADAFHDLCREVHQVYI